MRIVIAPDSYKESATAVQVADAIATGLKRVWPDAEITLVPMADGGEGIMDTLVQATNGTRVPCTVQDPLQRNIESQYGILGDGKTAVIEMAAASGLPLIAAPDRNPAATTTFGTGEMMRHALHRGLRHIVVGLGGSVTNDGGTGMASALGYSFLDSEGNQLPPGGLALAKLVTIDTCATEPLLIHARIEAAYDVDVPLYGPVSTSMMFARQKGADESMAHELDDALAHFAHVIHEQLGINIANIPGAGAAGGLGAGLAAFTGAKLVSGVDWVAKELNLESKIQHADLVITGEGKLDAQTQHGKVPAGVAAIARKHSAPIVAFAGYVDPAAIPALSDSFDQIVALCTNEAQIPDAIRNTSKYLTAKAEAFARDWERMIKSPS